MVRKKPLDVIAVFGIAVLFVAASWRSAGAAAEDVQVELCKFIVDRSTEYIRQGKIDKARRFKKQLETCGPVLKEALRKEAQEIVDRYYARMPQDR